MEMRVISGTSLSRRWGTSPHTRAVVLPLSLSLYPLFKKDTCQRQRCPVTRQCVTETSLRLRGDLDRATTVVPRLLTQLFQRGDHLIEFGRFDEDEIRFGFEALLAVKWIRIIRSR